MTCSCLSASLSLVSLKGFWENLTVFREVAMVGHTRLRIIPDMDPQNAIIIGLIRYISYRKKLLESKNFRRLNINWAATPGKSDAASRYASALHHLLKT